MLSQLRIGSRRSDLARLQAKIVGAELGTSKFVFKEAPGDVNLSSPLWKMPEMGIFTSFLRKYLTSGEIDLVVHSWKDLPIDTEGLTEIVGTMPREDERDLFMVDKTSLNEAYQSGTLVVLSSSPRRKFNLPEFLLKSIPPKNGKKITKIEFRDVRGNIQTRLGKMGHEGHALIVAKAAIDRFLLASDAEFLETGKLVREALNRSLWQVLPLSVNPTAAAQGALAVEMSSSVAQSQNRVAVKSVLTASRSCVDEERSILHALGGGCHQKIGCTILDRSFGRVTFLRGETDATKEPLLMCKIRGTNSRPFVHSRSTTIQIGGRGGVQLFDRKLDTEGTQKLLVSLADNPQAGLFVAKADAVVDAMAGFGERPIWTSGVQTMFSMASRGYWVSGTCDSLGEDEPKRVEQLIGGPLEWIKATHTDNSNVGTYSLVLKETRESVLEQIANKQSFFFSSGSGFTALTNLVPELIDQFRDGTLTIGCGPGSTLKRIGNIIDSKLIVVGFNYEDYLEQTCSPKE